jgi:hypothetical protein
MTSLTATDATSMILTGDSDFTLTNTVDPATPVLATIDASGMTGDATISGTNTAAAGATITFGSGDDTFNVATSSGADTITLGTGADTIVYNALAQSDDDMDTITDFVSGTDKVDVRGVMGGIGVASSTQFIGNRASFGLAQGALSGVTADAVYQVDDQILWVDTTIDGTLDNRDFRVKLDGVESITAADLGFGVGNDIELTAPAANVGLAVNTFATDVSTPEDDTISSTAANLAASTIDGGGGTDVLTVTGNPSGITSLIAAAGANPIITNVETINFNDGTGTLNLAGAVPVSLLNLNVSGGNLTATTTAKDQTFTLTGSGVGTLTFGLFADTTFNTDAGADTINAVTLASQTVSTGAGVDTINVTADVGMGADIDGGAGADILNWTTAGAASTMTTIDNIETVSITNVGAGTLTINDDVTTVTSTGGGVTTINTTATTVDGVAMTLGNAADVLNITTAGTFTLGTLTAVEDVNFAAGDNTVTSIAANVAGATTGFDGGSVGDNTLTLTTAAAAVTDLDTVTGFDTINLGGAANAITFTPDTVVAAGESILIDASNTTGALTLYVSAETDGVVNVNVGDNGTAGTGIIMAANTLADTITLGAGADDVVLDATSIVNNISELDTIVDFKASGADTIDFATASTIAVSGTVYTLSIASASLSGLAGAANTEIANQGIVTAAGDMYILEVAGGAAAGTYAVQDLTADNITGDDFIVELAGVVGAIAPADFI